MDALRCRFNRRKRSKQRTEMKSIRLPSSKRKLSLPSVISVISCLSLIQRFTHRGDKFFVIERFHEKRDRANGHGGGARGQIFARGDDNDTSLRRNCAKACEHFQAGYAIHP